MAISTAVSRTTTVGSDPSIDLAHLVSAAAARLRAESFLFEAPHDYLQGVQDLVEVLQAQLVSQHVQPPSVVQQRAA